MVDVVGVGLNATDTIITLPHFPEFDTKVEFADARVMLGGQVATAMMACRAWGLRARYVGTLGDDEAARLHTEAFAKAEIAAQFLTVPDCLSQQAYILVDSRSGERTIIWRRDPRLTLRADQLQREWVIRARAVHVDGHDPAAAAQAARWAREAGIPVTADVDNVYPGLPDLLRVTDYLLASRGLPERLTGEADLLRSLPRLAAEYGCQAVGATLGSGGVIAWDGETFHYSPAFAVNTVDTTGAGDIFHGAFLYALLAGWPLPKALDFSCAAAALNCTALGARGGIRPVAEIEHLMRTGSRHPAVYDAGALAAARRSAGSR